MTVTINQKKGLDYFGRHGWGDIRGLEITEQTSQKGDYIAIEVLNSRGVSSSIMIQLYKDVLPELIEKLKTLTT